MQTKPAIPEDEAQAQAPAITLRAEQMTKVFPGTVALDHVDFNVYRGKVNVLIGENGAGKSTLMKIIAGVEMPTAGTLWLDGKAVRFTSPLQAAQAGIGIIYQELDLFPNLSVASNVYAARSQSKLMIDRNAERQHTQQLLAQLEQDISPDALLQDLPLGQQQIVAIARALAQDARILIMDEPTSALSSAEVASLFRVIRDLTARGVSIVYISHKLEELLRIGDFITVLRDGKLQAEAPASTVNVAWIIEKMIGHRPTASAVRHAQVGSPLLIANNITLPRAGGGFLVHGVSLSVAAGEVVGIYGLMGAGRTELCECLIGLRPEATGHLMLSGQALHHSDVAQRIGHGLVLVPEDRQRAGLVQTLSVAHNMTLASLQALAQATVLSRSRESQRVQDMIHELRVKVFSPTQPITALSGGNQQKVVVGKALLTTPKVLLLDEPTRGIDVGAKAEIFHIMHTLASKGLGVLFISSELNEVLLNADRILVMSKGKITGEFSRAEATQEKLVSAAGMGHGGP
jgi:erythritol transport system ATP-binding protein